MKVAFTFLFLVLGFLAQGQRLPELEKEMAALQNQVGNAATAEERLAASAKFEDLLTAAFGYDESFEYAFSSLPKVVKHKPEDGAFRLFNWNVPLDDDEHTYRMYLLFPNGKYTRFDDTRSLVHSDETASLSAFDWYGALYYEIHPVKIKRETYYTLVGWDGHDGLTTKKVLDVLVLGKKNKVSLGFPIFEKGGSLKHRRVFEYATDVVMNLRWLEPKKMIIFDHLEPKTQNLEGSYAFYGPSTTFDGYRWEDSQWKLSEMVDMSRPKGVESGAQFNFPDRPDLNRKREKVNPLIGE